MRALLIVLAFLAVPASAQGAVVISQSGDTLIVQATTGFQNNVGFFQFSDADPSTAFNGEAGEPTNEEPTASGAGCTQGGPGSGYTNCTMTGAVRVNVFLLDRDDFWNRTSFGDYEAFRYPLYVDAGDGNDRVEDGSLADTIVGGAGDDRFTPPKPEGGDVFQGGSGRDSVEYTAYVQRVVVTVGGGADDGVTGEGDDIGGDVERVVGTALGDDITAGPAAGTLDGAGGPDTLRSRNGVPDTILCGEGDDTAIVDHDDTVEGCEQIDRSPAPPPPPPPDADADGIADADDCDDANPSVRPGAPEIPGNGLDDDCTAGDEPAVIAASVTRKHKKGRITSLKVIAPAGATAVVRCLGKRKRCPKGRTTFDVGTKGRVSVFSPIKGRRLRRGATIEITVTAPGTRGLVFTYKLRPPKAPKLVKRIL